MGFLELTDIEKKKFLKKFIFKDIVGKKISNIIIPDKHYCSRFVVASAKTIFNWKKEYKKISGNAWNLKYNPNYKLVFSSKEGIKLDLKTLEPGMFLLLYNKISLYNDVKDKMNKPVDYTHVVLYVGKIDSKLHFIHMYKDYSELIDFDGLFSKTCTYSENEFEIKEVLSYIGD